MNTELILQVFLTAIDNLLFLITPLFAYNMITQLLNVKPRIWARILLYAASSLLTSMVIFIGDVVNLLPSVVLFLLAVWICCTESGLHKLAIGMIFSTFAFAYNAIQDNYINAIIYNKPNIFTYYLLSKLAFWMVMFFLVKRYAPEKDQELSPSMWKLMIALTLTPFGIVLSVVLLSNQYTETISGAKTTFLVLLLIALFSVISLFGTLRILVRQQQLERQNILTETNQRYYEAMEQQQFEVRRLKHDMSNQLNTIIALSDAQKEDYIQELLHNPIFRQKINYCPDSTINAVLTAKATVMETAQIPFHFHINITQELPLAKPDTCAIFANSLDNAIEACQKLPKEQRIITLETHLQKGLFVLELTNSCIDSAPIPAPGRIKKRFTTKPDKTNHGYGLHSIRETVQRYHGHLDIKKEQGKFTLFLYIPSEGTGDF